MAATIKTLIEKAEARAKLISDQEKDLDTLTDELGKKLDDLRSKRNVLDTQIDALEDIQSGIYDCYAPDIEDAVRRLKEVA